MESEAPRKEEGRWQDWIEGAGRQQCRGSPEQRGPMREAEIDQPQGPAPAPCSAVGWGHPRGV